MPVKSSVYIGSGLLAAVGLGVALDSVGRNGGSASSGGSSGGSGPTTQQLLGQPPTVFLPTTNTLGSSGIPPLSAWNHPALYSLALGNATYPAAMQPGGPTGEWGTWLLASVFTVPATGPYAVTAAAQSVAVLVLNGVNIGTVTGGQGLVTETVILSRGQYVLAATMNANAHGFWQGAVNSCPGYRCFVPAGTGGLGGFSLQYLYLTITSASGTTVLTTEAVDQWYYLPQSLTPQTTYDVYAPDLPLFGNLGGAIQVAPAI